MTRIDDIRARLAAATPGPWRQDGFWCIAGKPIHWVEPIGRDDLIAGIGGVGMAEGQEAVSDRASADAAFIAAAPDDIAYLLGEVERLSGERAATVAWLRAQGPVAWTAGEFALAIERGEHREPR